MIETVADILRDAYANGGGTYFVSVQRNRIMVGKSLIPTGYYVGTEGNEWCISRFELSEDAINQFIIQNFGTLTNGDNYLGIWQAESGRWYLDVSEHFRDASTALAIGAARKQLAVWDIARGREISTVGILEFA